MSLKFYGPHGVAKETLASGQPIPEGAFFQVDKDDLEDPHNIRLLEEGKLLPSTAAAEKAVKDVISRKDEIEAKAKAEAQAQAAEALSPEPAMVANQGDDVGQVAGDTNNEGGE